LSKPYRGTSRKKHGTRSKYCLFILKKDKKDGFGTKSTEFFPSENHSIRLTPKLTQKNCVFFPDNPCRKNVRTTRIFGILPQFRTNAITVKRNFPPKKEDKM